MQLQGARCRRGAKVVLHGGMAASWRLQAQGRCVMADITNPCLLIVLGHSHNRLHPAAHAAPSAPAEALAVLAE